MRKSSYLSLAMYAMSLGAMLDDSFVHQGKSMRARKRELSLSEQQAIQLQIQKRLLKINLKRGLKEFTRDGITVLALNQANADRKINRVKQRLVDLK